MRMVPIMDVNMIGLCGMNSSLCSAYQFIKNDLNKQGFHRKYCPGCIPKRKPILT